MKLTVNTNRIVAALIKDSVSRKILLSDILEFVIINFGKKEVDKYKNEILEKAGITEKQFEDLISIVFKRISVINDVAIQGKMNEAKEIMDKIDPDDTPFIAAALSVKNDGIWSDDRHFDKQDKIKIWKTKDLINYIE